MEKKKIGDWEVEIVQQKKNPLTKRLEVIVKLEAINKPTPKRDEAKEILAKLFAWNKDLIVIRKIVGYFGLPRFKIEAHLYENKESLMFYEPKHILIRNGYLQKEQAQTQSQQG